MFCEKCGNQLHEGDAFCEKCGAPVVQEQAGGVQAPAQPSAEQTGQSAPAQPATDSQPNGNTQPNYSGANYTAAAPAEPKVKKPFPKKILIICGAAAVVIAGIIVTLCILIPNLTKLEVKDYIKVELNESALYNGYAEADVMIDESSIEIDRLTDSDSSSESSDYSLSDYLDAYSDYSKLYTASEAIDSILDYITIDAYVKDAEESTEASSTSGLAYAATSSYVTVGNLHTDDVIVVEIKWDKSDSAKKAIGELEGEAGFKFDQSDVTTEINVSDVLSEQNLELAELEEIDIVSYLKENNCVKTTGVVDGEYKVSITPFEYTVGNYTVKYDSSSYYTSVYVYDEYEVEVTSVSIESTKSSGLSVGSKFKISVDEKLVEDKGVLIKGGSEEYTVAENKVMTSDEAKANIDKITTALSEYIDKNNDRLTGYSPVEIYYVTPKTTSKSSDAQAYILVVEKGKYTSYFSEYDTYYCGYYFENPYLIDGEVYSTSISSTTGNEDLSEYKESDSFLSSDKYTCTKIN